MPAVTALAASLTVALARRLAPDFSPFPDRRVRPWLLGTVLGLGYCAGELPNSFAKRRLGIPPGSSARRLRWLQYTVDQTDSVVGCLVALRLVYRPRRAELVLAAVIGAGAHVLVDLLMRSIGLRTKGEAVLPRGRGTPRPYLGEVARSAGGGAPTG